MRHKNIERAIHNFQLIVSALGNKDTEISQAIDASNAVFQDLRRTGPELPANLAPAARRALQDQERARQAGDGRLRDRLDLDQARAVRQSLAPAQEASRSLFKTSTPIIKNEIRPFAREILPIVNQLNPSLKELGEAFPGLEKSFSVFNEFFNELAYNPGPNQGGFLFFLDWANHDLNSVLSTADAHGPVGRTVPISNCEVLPLSKASAKSTRRCAADRAAQPAH